MGLDTVEPMAFSGWRIVKAGRTDVCPLGGKSPVITTISYGELLLTDLCSIPVKSCMRGLPRDGGRVEFRATGAGEDASRGRRHASLVRLMVLRPFC